MSVWAVCTAFALGLYSPRAAAPPRLGINAHGVLILHHWPGIDAALAFDTLSDISFRTVVLLNEVHRLKSSESDYKLNSAPI